MCPAIRHRSFKSSRVWWTSSDVPELLLVPNSSTSSINYLHSTADPTAYRYLQAGLLGQILSTMSAADNQSALGSSFGPNSGSSSKPTPANSVGSATAAGHGQHPDDHSDGRDSNATLPGSKVGPQNEDLEGEQMATLGEGDVMDAQLDKKNAGWGEQDSLTSGLDRKKKEQAEKREEIKDAREAGENVDGGQGVRYENEGLGSV